MAPASIRLGSLLYWVYFVVTMVVFWVVAVVVWIIVTPFDRNRTVNHLMCAWQGSMYLDVVPTWNVTVVGREKVDPKQAYVYVANHASISDPLLVLKLKTNFKFVSKTANFRIPLVGWSMALADYIPLERGNSESIKRMMEISRDWLNRGVSVLMFPEGTRTEDGRLKAFKHGAFTLARECNVPVLPIAIHGSHLLARKNSSEVAARAEVKVEVLDAIHPRDFATQEEFIHACREAIRIAIGQEAVAPAAEPSTGGKGSPVMAS